MGRRNRWGERSVLSAMVLPFFLFFSSRGAPQKTEEQPFGIKVDVNLVVLHASVHDRQGHDVLNLGQENFSLYEDGVRQNIGLFRREDTPVTVGLIVDHSGSMREKLADVTAAARNFAQSSNPKDDMFVVNFNERVYSGLGRNRFTDKPAELEAAIARAPASGRTALYDAIAAGLEQLDAGHWDKKVLVVISDGGDNESKHSLADVTRMAERSSAAIFAIGIFDPDDEDANPKVLRRLAEATGGQAFFPKKLSDIEEICGHIAHDIRNQYTIGYVSSNPKTDGARRSLQLFAAAPGRRGLRVRTRTGYIAQKASE